jgi:penicillin-binding protein 1A
MLRALATLLSIGLVLALGGAAVAVYGVYHYSRGLPPHAQLEDYYPPTLTRLHAGDGRLLAEFATEMRVFVPTEAMPERLVQAFVAAEDQNFLRHPGVDFVGIVRAGVQNLRNLGTDRRLIGASTITQQVAKNFLLSNEVSIERKIREALLALRIERVLSKDRILELYLNEIYLGQRAYGVAAAALNYFDKSLDGLTLAEMAYLAGLPKAPNNYHPRYRPEAARSRRDYVIGRMLEDGYITPEEARAAMAGPVEMRPRDPGRSVSAPYFAEEVRRALERRYGEHVLYEGGLSVRTTIDPRLQEIAERAQRNGLVAYDRRHGWRGPIARIDAHGAWAGRLAAVPEPAGLASWRLALVLEVTAEDAGIGFADGTRGRIAFAEMSWARPWREDQRVGPSPDRPSQVVEVGDVVAVEAGEDEAGAAAYALRQIPEVEGAVVALDPHTGRVLAMAGGWDFEESQFNRATQARRQPGSAFKPFVYLTALENGFTPADIIVDAPIVIDQGPGLEKWKPKNYSNEFYGPSTLRLGLEKSRNLMTVRLANTVGMDRVAETSSRFGVADIPPILSMALGAGETTLLDLTTAYAMLANGGRRIEPALIERIQDRHGRTVYRRDRRPCDRCREMAWPGGGPPRLPDLRERVTDPATAFQLTWLLKGVVERGTGRRIASLNRPLAGKTGTTNESFDTWFIGFAPDLVVGVFVGFDTPRTLGPRQTGSSVAAPVFKEVMEQALAGQPPVPFRIPREVRMVRIDPDTGLLPSASSERVLVEAFKPGSEPTSAEPANADARGAVAGASAVGAVGFDSGLY